MLSDFLAQLKQVEDRLFQLYPDQDKNQGFSKLIKYLNFHHLMEPVLLNDLRMLWQFRNKLVNSTTVESAELLNQATATLKKIKQFLNI